MELQPGFEHRPFTENELGFPAPGIDQIFDHPCLLQLRTVVQAQPLADQARSPIRDGPSLETHDCLSPGARGHPQLGD
jgi:hypothetical protein